MSDTPRTDDAQFGTGRVSVDFARQLERELASANARIERMSETANYILDRLLQTAPQDVFEDCQERWNKAIGQ